MDKDSYFLLQLYPSEGDYKLWSDSFKLFNTDKSRILRKSGQLNVSYCFFGSIRMKRPLFDVRNFGQSGEILLKNLFPK